MTKISKLAPPNRDSPYYTGYQQYLQDYDTYRAKVEKYRAEATKPTPKPKAPLKPKALPPAKELALLKEKGETRTEAETERAHALLDKVTKAERSKAAKKQQKNAAKKARRAERARAKLLADAKEEALLAEAQARVKKAKIEVAQGWINAHHAALKATPRSETTTTSTSSTYFSATTRAKEMSKTDLHAELGVVVQKTTRDPRNPNSLTYVKSPEKEATAARMIEFPYQEGDLAEWQKAIHLQLVAKKLVFGQQRTTSAVDRKVIKSYAQVLNEALDFASMTPPAVQNPVKISARPFARNPAF